MLGSVSRKMISLHWQSKLTVFLVSILIGPLNLLVTFATPADAKGKGYQIFLAKPVGIVEIMPPGSSEWIRVVKNRRIPLFSNLLLHDGASVDVYISGNYQLPKGIKGDSISLKGPMSLILDTNFTRTVRFNHYFWEHVPDELMKIGAKSDVSAIDASLAMFRDFVEIRNIEKNREDSRLLTKNASEFLKLNVQVADIDILSPSHGDAFYVNNFPFDLKIDWTKIKPSPGYFLLIWKSNEEVAPPAARVLGHQYIHRFEEPGEYYIQIIGSDGKRRSDPSLINILSELNSGNKNLQQDSDFFLPIFPADQTILTKLPVAIDFRWEKPTKSNASEAALVISAVGKLGEKRVSIPEGATGITLWFKSFGKFRWHVEFKSKVDNKVRSSTIALFTLNKEVEKVSEEIRSILSSDQQGKSSQYHSYIFW